MRICRSPATDVALVAGFAALIAAVRDPPGHQDRRGRAVLPPDLRGAARRRLPRDRSAASSRSMLYLAGGAIGLPIFSGGAAGARALHGPDRRLPRRVPLAAALCGSIVQRNRERATAFSLVFTAGLLSSFLSSTRSAPSTWPGGPTCPCRPRSSSTPSSHPGDILKNVLMALVATWCTAPSPTCFLAGRETRSASRSPREPDRAPRRPGLRRDRPRRGADPRAHHSHAHRVPGRPDRSRTARASRPSLDWSTAW